MSVERCPQQARFFHPDLKECVTLDMVPQEHGGTMPKCEGRVDGKYLDDLGRCNQFTVCASGAVAEIIKCKKGELYDALPQTCVESAKACEPCGEMNSWYVSIIIFMIYIIFVSIIEIASTLNGFAYLLKYCLLHIRHHMCE